VGCSTAPSSKTPPIQTASLEKLIQGINSSAANLKSLKSTLDLQFVDPSVQGTNKCKALLAYEKPGSMYLKGYRSLVPTFFTLVAEEGNFSLHIPRDNIVLQGEVSTLNNLKSSSISIRPDDILRSIEIAPIDSNLFRVELQEKPTYYIVSLFEQQGEESFLKRQLWIERYYLTVEKEFYYNALGITEIEILRNKFFEDKGVSLAGEVQILRSSPRSSLYWNMVKKKINPTLKRELFEFTAPEGVSIETLQ